MTENLVLPPAGEKGSTITWSAQPEGWIDAGTGALQQTVTADVPLTLTATISYEGGTSKTRVFDLTVMARYFVNYHANGGTGAAPQESNKNEGDTFTLAAAGSFLAPRGMQFVEWNTAADGTGEGYPAGAVVTMPAGDLDLYAIWEGVALDAHQEVYFSVTAPESVTAGEPCSITITARDSEGNRLEDYQGIVRISTSDPVILGLPLFYQFAEADAGSKTLEGVIFRTIGVQTLSVADIRSADGYWKFDEGTGITVADCSHNGNDGTLNDPEAWGEGVPTLQFANPSGIKLDGANDYAVINGVNLDAKSFTISFWAKHDSLDKADEWIISQGKAEKCQGLHVGFRNNNTFSLGFWGADLDVPIAKDTAWHHWAVVYDRQSDQGGIKNIFRDGEKLSADHWTTNTLNSTAGYPLYVGMRFDLQGRFKGEVDDLRIYYAALSDAMIAGLAAGKEMQVTSHGENAASVTVTGDFAGGNGTEGAPYLVATPEQLDRVRNYPSRHFKQIIDIDLEGYTGNWTPIGSDTTPFTGVYNGNGYTISNLKINSTAVDGFVGLFGYVENGSLKNMVLENVDIYSHGT